MGFLSFLFGGGGATVTQAKEWVKGGATLLDVRTAEEFSGGHLPGAKNVPLQVLPGKVKKLGKKGDRVVVYCRSGGRSAQARGLLEQAGYEVCDLGPMSAWGG
jgi:rhodanese-related sulfurtransferase